MAAALAKEQQEEKMEVEVKLEAGVKVEAGVKTEAEESAAAQRALSVLPARAARDHSICRCRVLARLVRVAVVLASTGPARPHRVPGLV